MGAPSPLETQPAGQSKPSRLFVLAGVLATFLVFVACARLLIGRALTTDVPESVLVVRGNPAWDGTEISVDGVQLPRPLSAVFDQNTRYTISFHLNPGDYTLQIKQAGQSVYHGRFTLLRSYTGILRLPARPGDRTPATEPALPFGVPPVTW